MSRKRKYNYHSDRIKKSKIEYNGYIFHRNSTYRETTYYECSYRKDAKIKCRARLKIQNNTIIINGNHKGHYKSQAELAPLKTEIKEPKCFKSTSIIKRRSVEKYDCLLNLTSVDITEKSIKKLKRSNILKIPKNLNELRKCLEQENWKNFLKLSDMNSLSIEFVENDNDTKAVIFIDQFLKQLINNDAISTIFVDGTFPTVPKIDENNCQLWTILIKHDKKTFPIVYALMKGRKTEDYVNVLTKVKNCLNIAPKIGVSDFEKAEQKALNTVFPNIKIVGCFFHYSQALMNNADKHGITKGEHTELGWCITKLLISLALLPEQFIVEGFYLIFKVIFDIKDNEKFNTFFKYYEKIWINGFKPSSFCVFQRIHRMNNISERHNRDLKENLKIHATITEFFVNLMDHQRKIHSFLKYDKFWKRWECKVLEVKERQLEEIWKEIEETKNNLDLLIILYKLSTLIVKC